MVKYKTTFFFSLILFFLLFSFYPTIFELSKASHLTDSRREFILEHNYYWPDFNLYLSKVRQGWEGRLTAVERYTSEPHNGSLIQEFYIILGLMGKILGIDPNFSYQLGRLVLSPLLLFVILLLSRYYFKSFIWQLLAFIIVISSGSFPRFFTDSQGILHIGRYMEWWSNIDNLQRITFIPHILFGQVVSFYLLYKLTLKNSYPASLAGREVLFYIFLGNAAGLAFPPSLITLISVIMLIIFIKIRNLSLLRKAEGKFEIRNYSVFILLSLPSLLYIFFTTRHPPWSSLVQFHRTHPMMIPFTEYILGTGPIFFLGIAGAIISIIKRDRKFQPLIFWILATSAFAVLFTHIKEQSPLRFTQTGLFIPLGILGAYFFQQIWKTVTNNKTLELSTGDAHEEKFCGEASFSRTPTCLTPPRRGSLGGAQKNLADLKQNYSKIMTRKLKLFAKAGIILLITFYILENLYMMKVSLTWQTTWIAQRARAAVPLVPYPPQTMYPIKVWMDGIRWLKDNSSRDAVVLAEITAGNYIPAYSGNTVYFGQSNTVDYERKQKEVWQFFKGEMNSEQAETFLQNGRIKYVFFSVQEKERAGEKELHEFYPFLKKVYSNPLVTIYNVGPRFGLMEQDIS